MSVEKFSENGVFTGLQRCNWCEKIVEPLAHNCSKKPPKVEKIRMPEDLKK